MPGIDQPQKTNPKDVANRIISDIGAATKAITVYGNRGDYDSVKRLQGFIGSAKNAIARGAGLKGMFKTLDQQVLLIMNATDELESRVKQAKEQQRWKEAEKLEGQIEKLSESMQGVDYGKFHINDLNVTGAIQNLGIKK